MGHPGHHSRRIHESQRASPARPPGTGPPANHDLRQLTQLRPVHLKVVSFIEPPQAAVIKEILRHCGLRHSQSPRAPPDVDDLVLELDTSYSGAVDSPDEADQSQRMTYVDIDTFLESF